MYYKLLTKSLNGRQNNVEIKEDDLRETLQYVIENYPFSTFPYIISDVNSMNAQREFKSGNCIALCIAGQEYLEKKYDIKSYIIPASCPKKYQESEYLHICHVALFIPQDREKGYILDFAFYFKDPIEVELNNYSDNFKATMNQIYKGTEEHLRYKLNISKERQVFNEYQEFPKNTKYVEMCYESDNSDCWNYYLREILNPDESITNFFIKVNKRPFICISDKDSRLKLYIHYLDDNNIKIKDDGEEIYKGDVEEIPDDIREKIDPKLERYFKKSVPIYLRKMEGEKRGEEMETHLQTDHE